MGRVVNVCSRNQRSLSWKAFVRMVALVMALVLACGFATPAFAKTADGDTILAFTSDVHNRADNKSRDRLNTWVDGLSSSIGHFEFMGFCGDMGDATNNATTHDEFWATAKPAFELMDTKTDKIDAIYYTTGNHEFNPGNFNTTTNACKNYYTIDSEAVNGDNYRIYCLGCRSGDQKSVGYTGDQITSLANYLASCGTDKPIFVMTHFPLHYYIRDNRYTNNAKGVIEALNEAAEAGKTVVLLWGHNHSQSDPRYDNIYKPGTTIDYERNKSTAFNFYYLAAGCMSDSEYSGSSSVAGKGLIITIDSKTGAITFTYYKKDLTVGESFTTDPIIPVTKYNVTWIDGDGQTLKTEQVAEGTTPSYTGSTPTKTPTTQYSYSFTGWSPTPAPLTADATYTAQFSQQPRTYTIIWRDGDNKVLKTEQLAYGTTPSYSGTTPTKASSAQYDYEFNNSWSPAITAVTGEATYTAQFNQQLRSYDITWKDGDGKVLKTDSVAYGTTPSYTGDTPTKTATAQYSYTFSNSWSPTIAAVTGEATYTAQFTSTVNSYTITWKNYDGQTLKTDTVAYGTTPSYSGTTPTRPATTEHTYEFSGWSPRVSSVTGNASYTAQFSESARKYTITWKGDGGQTLKADQVAYGTTPSYSGATPTKESTATHSYVFAGWNPEPTAVTGDATYTARFTEVTRTYTITWKDGDGRTLKTEQVEAGKTPAYSGSTPTKTATAQYSYEFNNGWSPTITAVAGDATYNAQFNQQIRSYDITWKDGDGRTLRTDQVAYGETPRYTGGTPTKASTAQYDYEFSGSWSPAIAAVTGEATYTAQFTQTTRTYAITWVDGDGQTLKTEQVAYGTTPSYSGATPTKTATAQYSYSFSGWNPALKAVTGDATYTAQFTSTVNSYTITWKNYDGSTLKTDTVAYGTTPSYSGTMPTRPSSGGVAYTFSGWNPSVTAVTGDATYTARFSSSVEGYTVTWKNSDGTELWVDEDVAYGTTPRYAGATPTKASTAQYDYEFSGWDPTPAAITGDVTYTARFTQITRSYAITWVDGDGQTLKTETAAYGTTPRYTGGTPTKASTAQYSYEFNNSWSPAVTAVTGDATYTAQFTQTTRTYAIAWVDGDGRMLRTDTVAYGETPRYTGGTPSKTATAQYSYTFSDSWSPDITAVTGDATYTAQFTQTTRTYTITWVDGDGKTLGADQVAYGSTPSYTGDTPTKKATDDYAYKFDGTWEPAVAMVTKDATYTANFTATEIAPEPPAPQDKWVRLSGKGRYQTMSAIVSEGFKTSDYVVLASGEKFADALVASALAGALDCPIVLTATSELSPEARQQIVSLHASTVYVVGGTAVISQEVRDQLRLLPDVEQVIPLSGKNRTETSRVVADAVVGIDPTADTIVVATGKSFADALSVSPWCYAKHYPIILTDDAGNLTADQINDIAIRYAAKKVVIVGGTGAVSQDAEDKLEAKGLEVERWKGKGRYETSAVIARHALADGMSLAHVAVATGNDFPDALAGAALCGTFNAPLVLATDKSDDGLIALDVIREGKEDVVQGYVLGGTGSVSEEVFEQLEGITD